MTDPRRRRKGDLDSSFETRPRFEPGPLDPVAAAAAPDEASRWLGAYRRLQALDALAHQLRLEGLGTGDGAGAGREGDIIIEVEDDARALRTLLAAWEKRLRDVAN